MISICAQHLLKPQRQTFYGLLVVKARQFQGIHSRGWWNKDHKPNYKYPTTPEERKAAAVKYGLREEDYVPVLDAMDSRGDYPYAGQLTYGHKDPWEAYTYFFARRNFGELVRTDKLASDPDITIETGIERITANQGMWMFLKSVTFLFLILMGSVFSDIIFFQPTGPKQFPFDFDRSYIIDDPRLYPLTHYTFEPEDEESPEGTTGHSHHHGH